MHLRVLLVCGCLAGAPWAASAQPYGQQDPAAGAQSQQGAQQDRSVQQPAPQATQPTQQQGTQQPGNEQTAASGMQQLLSANELGGRKVVTMEGETVGRVEFVTIGLDRGVVSHLIVDTSGSELRYQQAGGTQPGQPQQGQGQPRQGQPQAGAGAQSPSRGDLLILPWNQIQVRRDSAEVIVQATGAQLLDAPHLKRDQLATLTQPAVASYVVDYWLPASEVAAMEGQAQQAPAQQAPAQQSQGQQGQAQPGQMQRDRERMHDPEKMQKMEQMHERMHQGQTQGASQQQGAARTRTSAEGETLVLIGQEVVVAVSDPLFQLDENLRGSSVTDAAGNRLGEIRRIMIDPQAGAAAFAIVEGEGATAARYPVPIQALEWTAEDTTMLSADASKLQAAPELTDAESVDRAQLAQLYQRFDVRPYWEQAPGGM